jgi:hypothetical protein
MATVVRVLSGLPRQLRRRLPASRRRAGAVRRLSLAERRRLHRQQRRQGLGQGSGAHRRVERHQGQPDQGHRERQPGQVVRHGAAEQLVSVRVHQLAVPGRLLFFRWHQGRYELPAGQGRESQLQDLPGFLSTGPRSTLGRRRSAHHPPRRSSTTGMVLSMMRRSSRRLWRRMYSRS